MEFKYRTYRNFEHLLHDLVWEYMEALIKLVYSNLFHEKMGDF